MPTSARAAEPEAQSALLDRAERAERELALSAAVELYAQAEQADAESRLARRARSRIEYLGARSEGGFAPLGELLRAQRSADDPAALAHFEAKVSGFPGGRVRREARALIADAYLRLDRPIDAVRAHRAWLAEPNLDEADWRRATTGLARARARLGDLTGSLEVLRARGLGAGEEATYVELSLVRRWARPLSATIVTAFVLGVLRLALRRRPRKLLSRALSPARLLAASWVMGIPAVLAFLHRPETWRAMSAFVPGALAVAAAASLAGTCLSPGERRLRLALAAAAIAAQVGVAYFAFDSSGALFGWLVSLRHG
ncbi:MAG: hypothetical protein U0263_00455 [Polyangiaceae bacterium]